MLNPITKKSIILGVTGSIAAYKAADLASKLTQQGALVEAILTAAACKFITPLTFQSVTGRKAFTDNDLWGGEGHVTHIGLGQGADLMVIAPASANTIAKLAHGIGDNLLSVAALAARCPIIIAPAMDAGMYRHPATQQNVDTLRSRGIVFIGPAAGHLASGLVGMGRLIETQEIVGQIRYMFARNGPLSGKKVVVTAGGTQEPIDPVRFISNRSSGKQGYALAQAALDAGAEVILITGASQQISPAGCRVLQTIKAEDMLEAVLAESQNADALIMAAAVADFRPKHVSKQKIKKEVSTPEITLERTQDILAEVAKQKTLNGFPKRIIGFAAESENLLQNAREKLQSKKMDLIVANDITSPEAGFEVATNRVTLLFSDGRSEELPLMDKMDVAGKIIDQLVEWLR